MSPECRVSYLSISSKGLTNVKCARLRACRTVGACVVPRHRSTRVAEQHLPIFHRHAHCAQSTREGVAQVVDSDAWKADFLSRALPRRVVHRSHRLPAIGKHPHRILAALPLDHRPSDVVENHDVRAPRLVRFRRNDKHAASTSGTATSHSHCTLQTLLSRNPVLTAKSTIRARRAGNRENNWSCSFRVVGQGSRGVSSSIVMSGGIVRNHGVPS
jgi:hypothetical protein